PVALPGRRSRTGHDHDLQSIPLRGGARGPGPPRAPRRAEAPGTRPPGRDLGPPLPLDQRLGAASRGERDPRGEALPEPEPRRAAATLHGPDRRAGQELEVLAERRPRAGLLG